MSRVPHEPTQHSRELVRLHTTVGTTQAHIAQILGIDLKTLRKYYRDEMDTASIKANATVAKFIFRTASGAALKDNNGATYADCVRAAMFWAKTRMRWRETDRPGEDGDTPQAVTIRIAVDND